MYARPVVLDDKAVVKVLIEANDADITLTADGQIGTILQSGDQINFQRAAYHTKLIYFENQGIFEVLKSHLGEGRI